jgi:membrane-anchored protein YejM (alkaline phosphatase superfamily)
VPETAMIEFVPEFSLPCFLKKKGYKTQARISMPIINQKTILSKYFDSYILMDRYDDFSGMIDQIQFEPANPAFFFLNLGEAHYPYRMPKEDLPPLHGEGGVFRRVDDTMMGAPANGDDALAERYFNMKHLNMFRAKQIESIEYIDRLMERLLNKCPAGTHIIITSDHGELFGEGGYFGHGPIMHEKVFEVPYLEATL